MAHDASDAHAVWQKVKQFLNAARNGDLDLLKNLAAQLDEGNDLPEKREALHYAALGGQTEVCKYLLEELNLDVDYKDEDGETALMCAAQLGHTHTAKYLIDRGANPTIARSGATALHYSVRLGDAELLKHLLSRGINPDLESSSGTPLVWAAAFGRQAAVSVLLEHGANPNAETDDGNTPLRSSVGSNGSLACLELLIQSGAKVNVNVGGETLLHIAATYGSVEIINCLLKAGVDPNVSDMDGLKPIQVAAAGGFRGAVEILFPLTSKIDTVPTWTIDGILEYTISETKKQRVMFLKALFGLND